MRSRGCWVAEAVSRLATEGFGFSETLDLCRCSALSVAAADTDACSVADSMHSAREEPGEDLCGSITCMNADAAAAASHPSSALPAPLPCPPCSACPASARLPFPPLPPAVSVAASVGHPPSEVCGWGPACGPAVAVAAVAEAGTVVPPFSSVPAPVLFAGSASASACASPVPSPLPPLAGAVLNSPSFSPPIVSDVAYAAEPGVALLDTSLASAALEWPWDCLSPFAVLRRIERAPTAGLAKFFGKWCRQAGEAQADSQWRAATSAAERTRLLAVRNEIGGRWLSDSAAQLSTMSSAHWRTAARLRVGLSVAEAGQRCQHAYCGQGPEAESRCMQPLDPQGVHAIACAVGGGRLSRHSGVLRLITGWLREAGYGSVVREVLVPEWRRKKDDGSFQQAVLDIRSELHGFLAPRWLDVTVRVPGADLYVEGAAKSRGFAAARGEAEKHKRYPPRAGLSCTPLSCEIFGTIGTAFSGCISEWSAAASLERQGFGLPARASRYRWFTELSVCLAMHSAESALLACTVARGNDAHACR